MIKNKTKIKIQEMKIINENKRHKISILCLADNRYKPSEKFNYNDGKIFYIIRRKDKIWHNQKKRLIEFKFTDCDKSHLIAIILGSYGVFFMMLQLGAKIFN